jgi:hypothetical protein
MYVCYVICYFWIFLRLLTASIMISSAKSLRTNMLFPEVQWVLSDLI